MTITIHYVKKNLFLGLHSLKFVHCMADSLENFTNEPNSLLSDYDISDYSEFNYETEPSHPNPVCVVCLQERSNTWIFLPCEHANCRGPCYERLERQELPCPTCRASVENRFQIYLDYYLQLVTSTDICLCF